jgi:hypothetical protein
MLVLCAFSPGIRRPECEAEHSPTFNSKFKNALSYTSTPLDVLLEWCSNQQCGNFIFNTVKYVILLLLLYFLTIYRKTFHLQEMRFTKYVLNNIALLLSSSFHPIWNDLVDFLQVKYHRRPYYYK